MSDEMVNLAPADAQAELARITGEAAADPSHPYTNRQHPDHRATADRVMRLYETAHASDAGDGADPSSERRSGGEASAGSAAGDGMTAAEAQAEIDQIIAAAAQDPAHPYTNRQHPEHKATTDRMVELYRIAAGEAAGGEEVGEDGATSEYVLDPTADPEFDGSEEQLAVVEEVKGWLAEAEVPADTAAFLNGRFTEMMREPDRLEPEAVDRRMAECGQALHALWGDETQAKIGDALRAAQRLGGERFVDFLAWSQLGNDPHTVRGLAELAERRGW